MDNCVGFSTLILHSFTLEYLMVVDWVFFPTVMWNKETGNSANALLLFTHNYVLLTMENYKVVHPGQFQAFSSIFFLNA